MKLKRPETFKIKKAPTLKELQYSLIDIIEKAPNHQPKLKNSVLNFVRDQGHSSSYRISLYNRNYNEKYKYFLQTTFSASLNFISKKNIKNLLLDYKLKNPSRTISIEDSFKNFPRFLSQQMDSKLGKKIIYSLAQFEFNLRSTLLDAELGDPRLHIINGVSYILPVKFLFIESEWPLIDHWLKYHSKRYKNPTLPLPEKSIFVFSFEDSENKFVQVTKKELLLLKKFDKNFSLNRKSRLTPLEKTTLQKLIDTNILKALKK